jgi:mono/diheme cytochrome c family protein
VVTHAEPAASSPALPDGKAVQTGKALYRQRCAACHSEKDSGAPPQEDLTQLPHGQIVDVLENGVMRNMALGLSQEDIQSLATYLISPAAIP